MYYALEKSIISVTRPWETVPVITQKISGHHLIFGVTQNSFQVPLRLLPSNQKQKKMNQNKIIIFPTQKRSSSNNTKISCRPQIVIWILKIKLIHPTSTQKFMCFVVLKPIQALKKGIFFNLNQKFKKFQWSKHLHSYLMAALISSYDAGFSNLTVRSTTETSTVGTRKAIPVSFPFKAGSTLPTAWTEHKYWN